MYNKCKRENRQTLSWDMLRHWCDGGRQGCIQSYLPVQIWGIFQDKNVKTPKGEAQILYRESNNSFNMSARGLRKWKWKLKLFSSLQLLTVNHMKSLKVCLIFSPAGSLYIIIIKTGTRGDRSNILSQQWKYLLICTIILNGNVSSFPIVLTGNSRKCYGWMLCVQILFCDMSTVMYVHTKSQNIKSL